MIKRWIKRILGCAMQLLPLDLALKCSQRLTAFIARILMFRDWRLEAYGRPQSFKHEINLSLWRFEPDRWAFVARGVHAREKMFKGCSVLDLSCGDGSNSYLFFSDIAGRIEAVDNDPGALEYARRYHSAPIISYSKVDIVNEAFPAGPYDFVVWNAAICYFTEPDIRTILGKIARVGKKSMIFFGMLPMKSGYVDHKTEFSDRDAVKCLLGRYFDVAEVHEVDESAGRTIYFQASHPRVD